MQYWVSRFADNQELLVKDAIRHTISEDMEVLEVDSAREVIIVPMKQIKHRLRCDGVRAESKGLGSCRPFHPSFLWTFFIRNHHRYLSIRRRVVWDQGHSPRFIRSTRSKSRPTRRDCSIQVRNRGGVIVRLVFLLA